MFSKQYITLYWIWFWGALTVIFVMTNTDWGLVIGGITLVFVIGGTFWGIGKWVIRKIQLKNPFDVYYEPTEDVVKYDMAASVSPDTQCLQITLKIKTEVNVEHVSLKFNGMGARPRVDGLYNWTWGLVRDPSIDAFPTKTGLWYWRYNPPIRRFKTSRIRIGIKYTAPQSFNGVLEVGLTAAPLKSIFKSLPFEVKEI